MRIHHGGSFSTSMIETKLILCTKLRSYALDSETTQVVKSWRHLISIKICLVDFNFNTSYILLEAKITSDSLWIGYCQRKEVVVGWVTGETKDRTSSYVF